MREFLSGDLLPEPPGSIAVFARRTGVPASQLRRWHARGWLVPDEVDARSGYRRYAASQRPECAGGGHPVDAGRGAAAPQDVEVALPWPTDDVPAPFAARVLPARCICTVDGVSDVLAAQQLLDCWLRQEALIDVGPRRVSVVGDAVTAVSAVVLS